MGYEATSKLFSANAQWKRDEIVKLLSAGKNFTVACDKTFEFCVPILPLHSKRNLIDVCDVQRRAE